MYTPKGAPPAFHDKNVGHQVAEVMVITDLGSVPTLCIEV